jgi:hypothetical protein
VQFAAAVNGGDGDEASAQLPARKHPSLHLLRLHGVVSYATSLRVPAWLEAGARLVVSPLARWLFRHSAIKPVYIFSFENCHQIAFIQIKFSSLQTPLGGSLNQTCLPNVR